jgi:steroid delta-isomerase-like uncharacterized protein
MEPSLANVTPANTATAADSTGVVAKFIDAFARADSAALDGVVAQDFVGHSSGPDIDRTKLKSIAAWVAETSPDRTFVTEDLFAEGDRVVWRGVVRATFQGKQAFGFDIASAKPYAMKQIQIFRVAGGKLAEGWITRDDAGMLRQLGAIPGHSTPAVDAPSTPRADTSAPVPGAKQLVVRALEETWGRKDPDAALRFFASDVVNHEAIPQAQGAEGMRTIARKLITAFPDAQMKIEDVVASGDRVACRVTFRGTNSAPLAFVNNPLPATGKTVSVSQMHVFRVSGGKIVETWGTRDDLGLMRQLGVLPPAPAPHR